MKKIQEGISLAPWTREEMSLPSKGMNILSVSNLGKRMRGQTLFSSLTFGLEDNEKVGIVGKNGSGKSTLLKILSSLEKEDEGTLSFKNNLKIAYLAQNTTYGKDATIRSFLYEDNNTDVQILAAYRKNRDMHLLEVINREDLWAIERRYEGMLKEFRLNKDLDTPMDRLSGGEVKKVALARSFSLGAELMLFDEPTNHLDIRTIEILEKKLAEMKVALILVTHDRHILSAVTNVIFELDGTRFYRHVGTFESYLENRAERRRLYEREMERKENILRRELEWLKRGPKARTGKDKGRKERAYALMEEVKRKKIEEKGNFESNARRLGKKILEIKGVSKSYGERTLFKDFSFSFNKGMHIGLIGDNGSGKSTLLDMIAGRLLPDEGAIEKGENTEISYFDQNGKHINGNETVLSYMKDIKENVDYGGRLISIEKFLNIFSFPSEMFQTEIGSLSGGERRRLELISSLITGPNMLLLDEPTNDLDLETMENLEDFITSFPGVVLLTSHDRTFLDITTDFLFVIDDDSISFWPYTYTEWKEMREEKEKSEKERREKKDKETRAKREKKGLTFKEKKEMELLEKEIAELEQEVKSIEDYFSSGSYNDLGEKERRYEEVKILLEEKSNRYLDLLEKEG